MKTNPEKYGSYNYLHQGNTKAYFEKIRLYVNHLAISLIIPNIIAYSEDTGVITLKYEDDNVITNSNKSQPRLSPEQ